MLDRPYRDKRVRKQREASIERLRKEQAKDLEREHERSLKNAYPSQSCRVCGATGKGLRKVSIGCSYFLCDKHFNKLYTSAEEFVSFTKSAEENDAGI